MNTADADRLVRTALREVAPDADLSRLRPDADLRDALTLDSLDFLRLVELLSEGSGKRIDEEDYPKLGTFSDAVGYLSS
ncbi:MAG TPA: phosphopantetheine-binding protein [Micromonosporaceae bacterium]